MGDNTLSAEENCIRIKLINEKKYGEAIPYFEKAVEIDLIMQELTSKSVGVKIHIKNIKKQLKLIKKP